MTTSVSYDKAKVIKAIEILARSVEIDDGYAGLISHPLTNSKLVFQKDKNGNFDLTNAVILTEENKEEKLIKPAIDGLRKAKDLRHIIYSLHKPYWLSVLIVIQDLIYDEELFNDILRMAWTFTEFPHQCDRTRGFELLRQLFGRMDKQLFMEKEELEEYNKLPQKVTIYRGTQDGRSKAKGLSWTLDENVARWFARRWKATLHKEGKVYKAEVDKDAIYAIVLGREAEAIVDPSKIKRMEEI